MPAEQMASIGLQINGELHSSDASAGVELALYDPDGDQRIIGPGQQLELRDVDLVTAAGGDAFLYWALGGQQMGIQAASTSADTLEVDGDLTDVLSSGDTFYVQGSTGNDGEYTLTSDPTYDPGTNRTTLAVAAVSSATADGNAALTFFAVADADAVGNTLAVAGDQRRLFRVGAQFKVDGSTGNDNSGANYTVSAAPTYDSSTDRTTITVASVANGTDDGYIIPQPVALAGKYLLRGTYAANGGQQKSLNEQVIVGDLGHTLFCDAPVGVVDAEAHFLLRKNLSKSAAVGAPGASTV